MVMLSKLKEKLGNEDMPMPGMEVEIEGEEMGEGEGEMPEAKPMDLSSVSDEDLLSEAKSRGLV
jgi:hypothetical protein